MNRADEPLYIDDIIPRRLTIELSHRNASMLDELASKNPDTNKTMLVNAALDYWSRTPWWRRVLSPVTRTSSRTLCVVKVALVRWTDRLNDATPPVGSGQFQTCTECHRPRETDAKSCPCGGQWR